MFWNPFKKDNIQKEYIKTKIEQIEAEKKATLTKMENQVNWLQSMQKLDVRDGDIIILRHPGRLSKTAHDNLQGSVQEVIKESGFNIKVMVLEEGIEIRILRKEAPFTYDEYIHGTGSKPPEGILTFEKK